MSSGGLLYHLKAPCPAGKRIWPSISFTVTIGGVYTSHKSSTAEYFPQDNAAFQPPTSLVFTQSFILFLVFIPRPLINKEDLVKVAFSVSVR